MVKGEVPISALSAFDRERCFGADENLLNSSRSTRFMSPEPGVERLFRDAVLELARRADFARPMVNSGRLSRPCVYPLTGADDPSLPSGARPGAVAPNAPMSDGWISEALGGTFVLLVFGCNAPVVADARVIEPALTEVLRARYLGDAATAVYLIRPDQIVAARWIKADAAEVT